MAFWKYNHAVLGFVAAFGGLLVACAPEAGDTQLSQNEIKAAYTEDVGNLCQTVIDEYAYYDSREALWEAVCADASTEMEAATTPAAYLGVLERMIDDLYDSHIQFNRNSPSSPRLVPSGADVWFARKGDGFKLVGIRPGSGAAKTALQIGDELVSFNDLSPDELAATRMHRIIGEPSERRVVWALNAALAGNRDAPRMLTVRRSDDMIEADLGDPRPESEDGTLSFDILEGNIGHIRMNNSLGNMDAVGDFDIALEDLRETDGLILDLRNTPGGGGTDIAEPILGRLISEPAPYQLTVPVGEPPIPRIAEPSGDWTYDKPMVVLAGHWTGSMGEGMSIGLDGLGRATFMGDQMAGLAGGTECFLLEATGINMCLPTYDLRHVNGTPRHLWMPETQAIADFGNGEDLLLEQAVEVLSKTDGDAP